MANIGFPGSFSEKYILKWLTTPLRPLPPCFFTGIANCWFTELLLAHANRQLIFQKKVPKAKVKLLFTKVFSRLSMNNLHAFIEKILKMSYLLLGYTGHLYFLCFIWFTWVLGHWGRAAHVGARGCCTHMLPWYDSISILRN